MRNQISDIYIKKKHGDVVIYEIKFANHLQQGCGKSQTSAHKKYFCSNYQTYLPNYVYHNSHLGWAPLGFIYSIIAYHYAYACLKQ